MRSYYLFIAVLSLPFFLSAQNDSIILEGIIHLKGNVAIVSDTNSIYIGKDAGLNINEEFANANTFVGTSSGRSVTDGSNNTFLGAFSGLSNTTGSGNVMIGIQSGLFSTTGASNVFVGQNTGYVNTTGSNNTFLGNSAGFRNTERERNTFIGVTSGFENIIGSRNVFIGSSAGQLELGSDKLYIANTSTSDYKANTKALVDLIRPKTF